MDSGQLLELFRTQLADDVEPYLWKDAEIYGYMDDAQKMFCRDVYGIADASSTFTQVPLVSGQDWIPMDWRILRYKNAYRVSDGRPIAIVSYDRITEQGFQFNSRTNVSPDFIITGIEASKIRLYPIPNDESNDTIQFQVERLPLIDITRKAQALEIDPQHHRHLLLWMKHLAFAKQDADTYDARKSQDYMGQFEVYCRKAFNEKERRDNVPRGVAYGGPEVGGMSRGRWDGRMHSGWGRDCW